MKVFLSKNLTKTLITNSNCDIKKQFNNSNIFLRALFLTKNQINSTIKKNSKFFFIKI